MPRRSTQPSPPPDPAAPYPPAPDPAAWSDENSADFLANAEVFVPDREEQTAILMRLIPGRTERHMVADLGCGDGLLAETILEARPSAIVCGIDQSQIMLHAAGERCARFGDRFVPVASRLEDLAHWTPALAPLAAVSSLAIHHLDAEPKQRLFHRIFQVLHPGGVFAIADLVSPATAPARELAADQWDESVRARSLAITGSLRPCEFFLREHWNAHRYLEPEDIDKPSRLADQLHWLEAAGFVDVDVCWMRAGHAIFGARKPGSP